MQGKISTSPIEPKTWRKIIGSLDEILYDLENLQPGGILYTEKEPYAPVDKKIKMNQGNISLKYKDTFRELGGMVLKIGSIISPLDFTEKMIEKLYAPPGLLEDQRDGNQDNVPDRGDAFL